MNYQWLLFFMLSSFLLFGQQGDGGSPKGINYVHKAYKQIDHHFFEQPDIEKLRAEDRINDSLKTGPWRFGYNNKTSLDLNNAGTWFTNAHGDQIWLLALSCEDAKTINLSFRNTSIPQGNELFVYNEDKSFILGKFTQRHLFEGSLGTELVPGEKVIVEYFVPAHNTDHIGSLEISRVTHGYRRAGEYRQKAFGSSGACNMNVNCPDGSTWQNQRNSVVMLVSGGNGFCTGALINNTLNDGTPYVLTANHCYSDPSTWVFRFKWQSDDCPNPGSSPSFESLSGSTLRARRTPSDMMLVEITGGLSNGTVPQLHNPYFSGWNNSDTPPTSTVGIHHPSGDIKKISFDDDASSAVQEMGSSEPESSWEVVWDRNTTTEGGSSGSPLFDQDQRIIGQLWGGQASCGNLTGKDWYGRVHKSWNPTGSSNSEQLEHWLDPNGTGAEFIDGYDPYFNPLDYDVAAINLAGVDGIICGDASWPYLTIRNNGLETITSIDIIYSYNGNQQTMSWTGNLTSMQTEVVALPYFGSQNNNNSITVELVNPNGQTDEDPTNNELSSGYVAIIEGERINMDLTMDCYAQETSWYVEDDNGDIWYEGDGYESPGNDTLHIFESFCLLEGCYKLVIEDSYGDGMNGSTINQCDYDGSMQLTRETNGALLDELTEADSDFGNSITFNFCAENTAGVEELEAAKIVVYPNPNKGLFKIRLPFSGKKKVALLNVAGKALKEIKTTAEMTTLGYEGLASGVYFVLITTDQGAVTKKVVVE